MVQAPKGEKTIKEVEQEMMQNTLHASGWNIEGASGAAARLGAAPSTLPEKIKKFGMQRRVPVIVKFQSAWLPVKITTKKCLKYISQNDMQT